MGLADLAKEINVNVTEGEIAPQADHVKRTGQRPQTQNGVTDPFGSFDGAVSNTRRAVTGNGVSGTGSTGRNPEPFIQTRQTTQSGGSLPYGNDDPKQYTGGRTRGNRADTVPFASNQPFGLDQRTQGQKTDARHNALVAGNPGLQQTGITQRPSGSVFPTGGTVGTDGSSRDSQTTGGRCRGSRDGTVTSWITGGGGFQGWSGISRIFARLPDLWGIDVMCISITIFALFKIITNWESVLYHIAVFMVRIGSFALVIGIILFGLIVLFSYLRRRYWRRRW